MQAATVMKVAPGILLLLIGELESIFQDSNRREAKTEKQKEKNPSILFFFYHLSTTSPLSGYIRHSVLNCLFALRLSTSKKMHEFTRMINNVLLADVSMPV